jgi:hypothetical protein
MRYLIVIAFSDASMSGRLKKKFLTAKKSFSLHFLSGCDKSSMSPFAHTCNKIASRKEG